MPVQKDIKRRVRARMKKTGESYTTARARLLEKRPGRAARPAPNPSASPRAATGLAARGDLAALAGMGDAAVAKKTGRSWKEWGEVLDRSGAAARPHAEIAHHLKAEHGLPAWWAQTVAVGYERIRGLREKGQQRDGGFRISKSKTYPVPVETLWTAFVRCKPWMGDVGIRMSKASRPKSMRMRWSDGTPVEVTFWPKGVEKSQLLIEQRGLATRAEATRLRAFWSESMASLGAWLARSR